jgi:hypothetical protein
LSALQGAPAIFKVQLVPSQWAPGTQSASPAQLVLHALASQMYGLQAVVTPAAQFPDPSQAAAAVAIASVQLASLHAVSIDG